MGGRIIRWPAAIVCVLVFAAIYALIFVFGGPGDTGADLRQSPTWIPIGAFVVCLGALISMYVRNLSGHRSSRLVKHSLGVGGVLTLLWFGYQMITGAPTTGGLSFANILFIALVIVAAIAIVSAVVFLISWLLPPRQASGG